MQTHVVTSDIQKTIDWLIQNQACFDSFTFDVHTQTLTVYHEAGKDVLRLGMYLTAQYGILVTS